MNLTPRENEVLKTFTRFPDDSRMQTAERLGISYKTLDAHQRNLSAKLNVHTRLAAVLTWLKQCGRLTLLGLIFLLMKASAAETVVTRFQWDAATTKVRFSTDLVHWTTNDVQGILATELSASNTATNVLSWTENVSGGGELVGYDLHKARRAFFMQSVDGGARVTVQVITDSKAPALSQAKLTNWIATNSPPPGPVAPIVMKGSVRLI